jgi:hypothetical protein
MYPRIFRDGDRFRSLNFITVIKILDHSSIPLRLADSPTTKGVSRQ